MVPICDSMKVLHTDILPSKIKSFSAVLRKLVFSLCSSD
jgi:hypothetical protein